MFKVNNKNNEVVNEVVLLFLLLTLNIFHNFFGSVSIADYEKVNSSWILSLDAARKVFQQMMVFLSLLLL